MGPNYPNNRNTRTDRFGNAFEVKRLTQVTNKKTGEVIQGCFKGYVEIKGQLYKIETSPMSEEKMKNDLHQRWMKVTKMSKQRQSGSL